MRIEGIDQWLTAERTAPARRRYAHQLLRENAAQWEGVVGQLRRYFRRAHDDIIRHMRQLARVSLHPLRPRAGDPARFYPCRLHSTVLKGYFGEVFAGVLAEHFAPAGADDWEVPAFLFRNHRIAFQQLERYRQTGELPGPIPGRFGDDCLAFRRNGRGTIIGILFCESKCTRHHDTGMIAQAHEKLSGDVTVDLLQLVEVMEDAGTPDAAQWVNALRRLHHTITDSPCERVDLFCYICGQHPVRSATWLATNTPHAAYRAPGRHLEAVEVHLNNVEGKVAAVYNEGAWK